MNFLLALMLVGVFCSPLLVWLFAIRPYCFRHGRAYTPGALIWVTFWIDWQNARELAVKHDDHGMRFICGLFFVIHSIYTLLIMLGSLF